jgi:serine/threonine protein kinase
LLVSRQGFHANSTFAEYELVKELGEGVLGKVVLGVHRKTGQKYAIKMIKSI